MGLAQRMVEERINRPTIININIDLLPHSTRDLLTSASRAQRLVYMQNLINQKKAGVHEAYMILQGLVTKEAIIAKPPPGYEYIDGKLVMTAEEKLRIFRNQRFEAAIPPIERNLINIMKTTKGNWWLRFNAVWDVPIVPFYLWDDVSKRNFIAYLNDHWQRYDANFDQFDSSIKEVVEVEDEEVRGSLRDLVATLINADNVNHTYSYFGLNYNPHSIKNSSYHLRQEFINALKKYWPRYEFYITKIQNETIEAYWFERTSAEDKIKLIKTLVISASILLAGLTAGLTLGLTAGVLAGVSTGAAITIKELTGLDIDPDDINDTLTNLGDSIENNSGNLLDGIGNINIDLDTTDIIKKIKHIVKSINLDPKELGRKLAEFNIDLKISDFDLTTIDLQKYLDDIGQIDYDAVVNFLTENIVKTNNHLNEEKIEETKQTEIIKKDVVKAGAVGTGIVGLLIAGILLS